MASGLSKLRCVTRPQVFWAIDEFDRLGSEAFFATHGYGPSRSYELEWKGKRYPHKALLGAAYEFATGERLQSSDFEGGKAGAVALLEGLGFTIVPRG